VRELVLAIIDVGIIGGLLWSLWFVFAHGRRERKRIAEHLAAPLEESDAHIVVRANFKASIFYALFFGWLAVAVAIRAVETSADGETLVLALSAALMAWLASGYAKRALLRRPMLSVDGNGLTVGWPARTIPWRDLQQVRLVEYRSAFGVTRHRLACEVAREDGTGSDQLAIELELLSLSWNEVVVALQNHMGRRVAV